MRVMVTGGAGFIGSHIVEALHRRGIEAAALDNLSVGRAEHLPPDVALYRVDVRDREGVLQAFADFRPSHVSHQAAQASVKVSLDDPLGDAAVNVIGGLHVLEAVQRTGARRIVFASTGGVMYGEVPEETAAREDQPVRPHTPYAAGKAAFEHYLDTYRAIHGIQRSILRYGNVYGPRQDALGEAGVVAIFMRRLLADETVTLNARHTPGDEGCVRDYIYVDDVVAANLLALNGDLDGIYNVGTGVGRNTAEVLAAVARALMVEVKMGHPAPPRPGDLERSVLDPARLTARGWRPAMGFAEGIARTAAWFKESWDIDRQTIGLATRQVGYRPDAKA